MKRQTSWMLPDELQVGDVIRFNQGAWVVQRFTTPRDQAICVSHTEPEEAELWLTLKPDTHYLIKREVSDARE